jgi:hypothetical protein
MGKRKVSSLQKALLIAAGLAFIAIGVLWTVEVVFAEGDIIRTISVNTDVKNDDKLVSVKESFTTIETERLTIKKAKKIEVAMFSEQRAIVRFKVDKDFAHALVLNHNGDINETREFVNKRTDIEFSGSKTNTIFILASDDDKYGSDQDREEFLDWCARQTRGRDKGRTIDFFIDESVIASSSNDFAGIVVVKTIIVQPKIANISWKWDDDELDITGTSNLPRYTEIEWEIFGKFGITKAKRNGKISFDVDLEGISNRDDYLKMRVVAENWFQGSRLGLGTWPESAEPGISIKPKATPTPKATPILTPTPTPTQKILTEPPEPVKDAVEEAVEQIQRAQETLEEERKQASVLKRAQTQISQIPSELIIGIMIGSALLVALKRLYSYKKRK